MKKYIYISVLIIALQSCSYSISKKRYNSGFNFDIGWNRTTSVKNKKTKNINLQEIQIERISIKSLETKEFKKIKVKPSNFELSPYNLEKPSFIFENQKGNTLFHKPLIIKNDSSEKFNDAFGIAMQYQSRSNSYNILSFVFNAAYIISAVYSFIGIFSQAPSHFTIHILPYIAIALFVISLLFLILNSVNKKKSLKYIQIAITNADPNNKYQKKQIKNFINNLENNAILYGVFSVLTMGFLALFSFYFINELKRTKKMYKAKYKEKV